MIQDLLPWVNLLLLPAVGLLMTINGRLSRIETVQEWHAHRLAALEGRKP